jgi:predicted nuclease of predicted toxin-antitoxin system
LNDPFLIDECLTLDLVAVAQERGHHATHVVFRGLEGTEDAGLLPAIQGENFVLVTSNGKDFLPLYAAEEIHPGLIIIVPGGIRKERQVNLFSRVLDVIEPMADLVNKVVEVSTEGMVEIRDWPPSRDGERHRRR